MPRRVEDGRGPADEVVVSGEIGEGVEVEVRFSLYSGRPAVAIGMSVTNRSGQDLLLSRLVLFQGNPPEHGFGSEFPQWPACRFLAQPPLWTGPRSTSDGFAKPVPVGDTGKAYWGTVIGADGSPSLAIGIGEAARSQAEIAFSAQGGAVGVELSSILRSDLRSRALRLPAGQTYTSHRMALVPGTDPLGALDNYTQFVCDFLRWRLQHPPYAGLFTAYGGDRTNRDPGSVSLSEERIAELISVADQYLKPYGLDTIKTQFHGLSSSKPGGGPVRKLTDEEAADPKVVGKLVSDIREKGFAPDDHDSRVDYPHGIAWHVQRLVRQGYRAAPVCRPFYNIKAGTPRLDQAAADLSEMAVKDWGYRYLMLDFNDCDYDSDNDTVTVEQGIHSRFQAVKERVGPEIFIEACMAWPGPVLGVADGYRPAHDWRGGIEESLASLFACRYFYHDRFFQCDSEFFDPAIRPFHWADGVQDVMSTEERVRLWVSYNAILGYSFLGGACLERVTPGRWHLFQRALPVQAGRARALDFMHTYAPTRWVRDCSTPAGAYSVLGLFNWDHAAGLDAPVEPAQWGLAADTDYLFFDFWRGEVFGPARTLPSWVAPFVCRVLHVQPVPKQPALVGNSRHVTGQVGIEAWQWDSDSLTLHAMFCGAPRSQEHYWIWLPGNEGVVESEGAAFEAVRPRVVRLDVAFGDTGKAGCRLRLDASMPVM